MDLNIRVDISRAKSSAVTQEHGITPDELREIGHRVAELHKVLAQERADGIYGFYDLYRQADVIEDVKSTAANFLEKGYENLVVLGIGGSALGTRALATALLPPYYNLITKRARHGYPRLFVMDNIDPMTFRQMMRVCQPGKTLFNVISKSGGTAETMAQLMILMQVLEKKVGAENIRDHVVVTTNPRGGEAPKSLLHPVADKYGLKEFAVPLNVGGRFSVFSPVGLFPAAMLGMDIDGLLDGCEAMDERCVSPDIEHNPAYLRAAVQYVADTVKDKKISVFMPYADSLEHVADWFCQLWAESLGKRHTLGGDEIFAGQTPVKALGATDQHSQIQLYREGPNDKIINIVEVKRFDRSIRIPDTLGELTELDYLRNKSMNRLMTAELKGTMDALKSSHRPTVRIQLPVVNANTVGQLLYMLQVETAMAGRLYNINAFDQPGVEEGKKIARKLMGGEG